MSFIDTVKNAANPSTIDSFKANIGKHGGLAPQNRFVVIMTPPQASLLNFDLQGVAASLLSSTFDPMSLINDPRDVALLCESCSLPGRQIQTIEHADFRQSTKRPNGYFNEDVTFVFHLTNDYYMKKMFDKWSGMIIDQESYKLNYKANYVSDIIIQQLDQNNTPIYGVKLRNAFPTTLQTVELNNSATDTTQKLSITMAYDDYEPEGAISSVLSGIKEVVGGIRRII
jgi:hypothetical protein